MPTTAALCIFVSCLFQDLSMALTVLPLFLLPLMLLAGVFVTSDSLPPYFWWIQEGVAPDRRGGVPLCAVIGFYPSL